MSDELSTVGQVVAWTASIVGTGLGTGFLGAWLQRRHEIGLKDKERAYNTEIQAKNDESNKLLHEAKHRAELEIERLRSQLDRERSGYATVHKMAAEREFQCYQSIWTRLMSFMEVLDRQPARHNEPSYSQWQRDLFAMREAFVREYRDSRPFYSEAVFQACLSLNTSAWFVALTDRFGEVPDIADKRSVALQKINEGVLAISNSIRSRIDSQLELGTTPV